MLIDISIFICAVSIFLLAIAYLIRSVKILMQKPVIGSGSKQGMRYTAKVGRKK